MHYIMKNEERRQAILKMIEELPIEPTFEITIVPYKKNKSRAQERLWHMWVGIIAKAKGYAPEEMKHLIKLHVLGAQEFIDKSTGEILYRVQSTVELKRDEYTYLINETERLASEEGIVLPNPADLYYEAMGY